MMMTLYLLYLSAHNSFCVWKFGVVAVEIAIFEVNAKNVRRNYFAMASSNRIYLLMKETKCLRFRSNMRLAIMMEGNRIPQLLLSLIVCATYIRDASPIYSISHVVRLPTVFRQLSNGKSFHPKIKHVTFGIRIIFYVIARFHAHCEWCVRIHCQLSARTQRTDAVRRLKTN